MFFDFFERKYLRQAKDTKNSVKIDYNTENIHYLCSAIMDTDQM